MSTPSRRILVVEDESITALDLKAALVSLGYTVPAIVSSGEQAIEQAAALAVDAVIMDIHLRGKIDGIAAAEVILARHGIPVVYLTAYGDEQTLDRARVTKPFGYLLKPFGERELAIALEAALFRRDLERKLLDQAAELGRSNADLEQFAYVASHDLREPLRMVSSYVELLRRRYRGKLDADADQFIDYAIDGVTRMQSLIDDLLSYSRLGSSRADEFAPVECEAVFERALWNLQVAVRDSGAVVTRGPLPAVTGDVLQLTQLFQNLIGNAVKFRGDEPPRVHVSAERDGREWIFSFADGGIGVEPEYAERIFVLFQRLHGRERYAGTGIGLAICKKIVERHGGRIWLEAKPPPGALFRFRLPATPEDRG